MADPCGKAPRHYSPRRSTLLLLLLHLWPQRLHGESVRSLNLLNVNSNITLTLTLTSLAFTLTLPLSRIFVHLWNGARSTTEFIDSLGEGDSFTDVSSRFEVNIANIEDDHAVPLPFAHVRVDLMSLFPFGKVIEAIFKCVQRPSVIRLVSQPSYVLQSSVSSLPLSKNSSHGSPYLSYTSLHACILL